MYDDTLICARASAEEEGMRDYRDRSIWGKLLDGLPWVMAGLLVGAILTWLLGGF